MSPKIGVIINNIGTPESPDPRAVGKYLNQFLMDPGVIRLPWLARFILVRGLIVPFRAKSSSKKYQKIWTDQGSPLMSNTKAFAKGLNSILGDKYRIEIGMNFGQPSISTALDRLKDCEKIIFCPMFPQFDASTTQAAIDLAKREIQTKQIKTPIKYLSEFYTLPSFINSFSEQLIALEAPHYTLFSFHGLPEKYLACNVSCGNMEKCVKCYKAQCYQTARLIAHKAALKDDQWSVSFQSRLGPTEWIKPYTESEIERLKKLGVTKLALASPAFVADCLETLEELGIELRAKFTEGSNNEFVLLSCPNADSRWISGFANLIQNISF